MHLELLNRIRVAPLLYLGRRSALRLEAFLVGYSLFPSVSSAYYTDLDPALIRSLRLKFGCCPNASGVFQTIGRLSNDDQAAFDLFYDMLDSVASSSTEPGTLETRTVVDAIGPVSRLL